MARPVGPPRTLKQQAAFDCGHRIANMDDWRAVDSVLKGSPMNIHFTRAELVAYRNTGTRLWWLWWWRGYWYKSDRKAL